jgi:hypothetical protein
LSLRIAFAAVVVLIAASFQTPFSFAEESLQDENVQSPPERPKILANRRWQEDWSVLADPQIAREPLDNLKYIRLSRDPKTYLSLGFNVRERWEMDHSPLFGTLPQRGGSWLLSRIEGHVDLHLGEHVQVFAQLQSSLAPGKNHKAPVDQDRLDVEQAFVGFTKSLGKGKFTFRLGRQLIAIDLQRFASVRDGPNLRQPYDAVYTDYERGPWRVTGGYTHPVLTRDQRLFDDYSSNRLTFAGILLRRRLFRTSQIAISYTHYDQKDASFTNVTGNEHRANLDARFTGTSNGFDWDVETMRQTGKFGLQAIQATAFGSLAGYSFSNVRWTPHIGIGLDVATGDHNPRDGGLETFNPLFPNGYYLAGYTGYPNVIHMKPAVTVHPTQSLSVMFAAASQWRETIGDAVYVFPNFPIARTAGRGGRYTGSYGEFRADWMINAHYSVALEAVHYSIGRTLRAAAGRNANYCGIEFRYGF